MGECKRIDLSELLSRYRGAVMGICALAILFFHDWITTVSEFPVIGTIERLLKNYGYYGVDVFFLLSGMGLAYSMKKESSIKLFYLKRLKRVYVPYLEVLILKAFLEKWSVGAFLSRALCIEVFSRGIYTFLWFVQMILWVYLLYPMLHRLLEKSKNESVLLAAIIVCVFVLEGLFASGIHKDYHGLLFRIPTFLIGVWIGRMSQKRHIVCTVYQSTTCALTLVCAYYACGYLRMMKGVLVMEAVQLSAFAVLFACMFAVICAWIESQKSRIILIGKWGVRLLAFCGVFTLELYCLQEFHWYIAGPLEGKLTYLQIDLLCMMLLPLLAYLLNRINVMIWNGIEVIKKHEA